MCVLFYVEDYTMDKLRNILIFLICLILFFITFFIVSSRFRKTNESTLITDQETIATAQASTATAIAEAIETLEREKEAAVQAATATAIIQIATGESIATAATTLAEKEAEAVQVIVTETALIKAAATLEKEKEEAAQAATAIAIVIGATATAIEKEAVTLAEAKSTATAEAAATATPIPMPTLTPKPTSISGAFLLKNSTIWFEPKESSSFLGLVYKTDEITVLGRNQDGSWIQIIAPGGQGWIAAKDVEMPVSIMSLKILTVPPPSQKFRNLYVKGEKVDIKERSVVDEIAPYQEHVYTFFVEGLSSQSLDVDITVLYYAQDYLVANNMQFAIYDQRQFDTYGHLDIDVSQKLGAGEYSKLEGNLERLFWKGGQLTNGANYYLRIANRSPKFVQYCLVPEDNVVDWSKCP